MKKLDISENWRLRLLSRRGISSGRAAGINTIPARVPGCVHTDLLSMGLIPDPFYADNEKELTWIHENDWSYAAEFDLPENFTPDKPVYLVCNGIDTISHIFLNGKKIGSTENMFRRFRIDIRKYLGRKTHELEVRLYSPVRYARQLEKKFGRLQVALNSERVYIRKAQYSFGWDWGPSLPAMGIWKPVYLIQPGAGMIENVRFFIDGIDRRTAKVRIETDFSGMGQHFIVDGSLSDEAGNVWKGSRTGSGQAAAISLEVNKPELWWPVGEGKQHLYRLCVQLRDGMQLLDEWEGKVGIRTVELQTEDQGKPIFRFRVNGKPVFCRGANWIPADSFLNRVSPEKYRTLLQQARDAGMNMIRVWGGGIYEQDIFYEICDELGLLVWQDFMFACGVYPTFRAFIRNIKEEFYQNINHLQHHCCLALWCGNNENQWGWFHTGKSLKSMPDYRIYHQIIPDILKKLDPERPYWPGSPWGFEKDPNSAASGNRHEWDIWSGWRDYTAVHDDRSLFVTEFGFQGPANRETLESVIPPDQRNSQGTLFENHNKQVEGNARLFRYLSSHLPVRTDWPDFIYLTQLNQGLALKTCLEYWRYKNTRTSGSLIWQLNDCWPVTSWSLIDSHNKPKLAYHFVKSVFGENYIFFSEESDCIFLGVYAHAGLSGQEFIRLSELKTGSLIRDQIYQIADFFSVKRNQKRYKTELTTKFSYSGDVLLATFYDSDRKILTRNYYISDRWKDIHLPAAQISLTQTKNNRIQVSSDHPVFFLDLQHPAVTFHERGVTILPGEEISIAYTAGMDRDWDITEIETFHLNTFLRNI